MATDSRVLIDTPPVVAVAAWLLPGSGYFLIGQRGRAFGVGLPIILLFIIGLLVAGVRVIEVPGYDVATGRPTLYPVLNPATNHFDHMWVLYAAPLSEIRDKPWSVPQVMTGPLAIIAGIFSVHAASLDPAAPGETLGAITHSRINEIGSLYLSVAGLLNLMAIIDSTWRASHLSEKRNAQKAAT